MCASSGLWCSGLRVRTPYFFRGNLHGWAIPPESQLLLLGVGPASFMCLSLYILGYKTFLQLVFRWLYRLIALYFSCSFSWSWEEVSVYLPTLPPSGSSNTFCSGSQKYWHHSNQTLNKVICLNKFLKWLAWAIHRCIFCTSILIAIAKVWINNYLRVKSQGRDEKREDLSDKYFTPLQCQCPLGSQWKWTCFGVYDQLVGIWYFICCWGYHISQRSELGGG